MTPPHGTVMRFWGGPSDGAQIDAAIELRHDAPAEWWIGYSANPDGSGYRLCGLVRHRGDDASVCSVTYVWKEVWDE